MLVFLTKQQWWLGYHAPGYLMWSPAKVAAHSFTDRAEAEAALRDIRPGCDLSAYEFIEVG